MVFCALQKWVTLSRNVLLEIKTDVNPDVLLCVAHLHTGHWNVTDGRWVVSRVATGGGVELGKARGGNHAIGQPCLGATMSQVSKVNKV